MEQETIDKKTLKEKLAVIDGEFNRIQGEIQKLETGQQQLAQKKAELNVELFRFQGESRLLTELLKEEKKAE